METIPRSTSVSAGFDELLESRLRQLLNSVGNISLEEVQTELTTLGQLIDDYKCNDEMLEGLLDTSTSSENRIEIRERLKSQHLVVTQNRAELERVHKRSHQTLMRSVQLLAMIERRIYSKTNKGSSYAPEICNYCDGIGSSRRATCPACNGKRTVLVYQPPLLCPRCNGEGRTNAAERVLYSSSVCIVCRGKGWALALDRR